MRGGIPIVEMNEDRAWWYAEWGWTEKCVGRGDTQAHLGRQWVRHTWCSSQRPENTKKWENLGTWAEKHKPVDGSLMPLPAFPEHWHQRFWILYKVTEKTYDALKRYLAHILHLEPPLLCCALWYTVQRWHDLEGGCFWLQLINPAFTLEWLPDERQRWQGALKNGHVTCPHSQSKVCTGHVLCAKLQQ